MTKADRWYECPKAWINREAAHEAQMFADAKRYVDHGTLPIMGGWLDQAPRFCEAVEIVTSEWAKYGGPE